MIRTMRAVVVEGRYDKIRLDGVTDALVVTTDGFNIFKDREKQALIRRLGRETGIVVLTDSDDAGFKIRKFVQDLAGKENTLHAYIPERPGKERRKPRAGAAGLLGVEGVDAATVEQALRLALACDTTAPEQGAEPARIITVTDLYEDGLNGCEGAQRRRERLLKELDLPTRLSTNALLALLNRLVGFERYKAVAARVCEQDGAQANGSQRAQAKENALD